MVKILATEFHPFRILRVHPEGLHPEGTFRVRRTETHRNFFFIILKICKKILKKNF